MSSRYTGFDSETGQCFCEARCTMCGHQGGGEVFEDESGHECATCFSNVEHTA